MRLITRTEVGVLIGKAEGRDDWDIFVQLTRSSRQTREKIQEKNTGVVCRDVVQS
jgi:hypothetical protein